MSNRETTVNPEEIHKFAQHAKLWWDTEGPLRTLHDINGIRLDFIQQHVQLSHLNVLDVGCGGGILCETMANAGANVTGIDAEIDTILVAQEHAKGSHLNVDYFCTSIEAYKNPCFDVITCMEMLEHVQNPKLVLQHCRRLLKPKGFLFLSTISRTVKAYLTAIVAAEYLLNLLPKQTHDYDKFIKPSELLAITRSLGFKLVDMKGMDYNPLLRKASLGTDLKVNYLLALQG
ncbi:bifunctional 2-polyprenyl-6-hydroxyphenol methylase/3-demethylubiquinol 3-O-methyltransferase UbiG [Legionella longbeachae]|uniref:Ubiquinone biosynthesis O-methyltransferase n=1 Tax=Legionella longbeachae serogroup 1 (strain NSW150) TaxID=661367 RepID=D3HT39_LEGLN|nr:bifunctional 2-polyprenyl-6-hydroxyphenol methylase/3-demethylubiquinol 3-O-methyltransferase UbiG [Legionella longbeachae]VEE02572.1 3-demethylubiquinone-9 3-methyltransferase [Legionella oakridgensis]HBD7398829.1 bifunctional 2-polyprenyl-6-hydroxyphenol methylase/3-demethylubiquinol 3-O-methyltransferase UbiG [Legionella pneumophila]ARB91164.1 bifunctional 2-polyprenyl-6-hydroxyphenol methylase/3-demethylubiquinol 3-O-methyltransferase UbiG [Legionella longbeachae]ARM32409.1 bifunctional 